MKESKETVCILTGVNLHKRLHLYQHPLLAKYTLIVLPCKIYNIYIYKSFSWSGFWRKILNNRRHSWPGRGMAFFFPPLSDLTRKVQTSCQCSTNIGVTGRSRVDARRRRRSPNNWHTQEQVYFFEILNNFPVFLQSFNDITLKRLLVIRKKQTRAIAQIRPLGSYKGRDVNAASQEETQAGIIFFFFLIQ